MSLTVDGSDLSKAIAWGCKATSGSLDRSGSGGVAVVEAVGSEMSIRTYDGERMFIARAPVSGMAAGESLQVRVPSPELKNIGEVLGSNPVTMDTDGSAVTFTSPEGQFSLGLETRRAPNFPDAPPRVGTVNLAEFRRGATRTAGAAAPASEASGFEAFSGVLIELDPQGESLRMEATDRMVLMVRDIPYSPDPNSETVIPESGIIERIVSAGAVKSLLSGIEGEGDIDLHVDDDLFFGLSSDRFEGYVQVLNANPIPYRSLLGLPASKRFTFDRAEFSKALNRVRKTRAPQESARLEITQDKVVICSDSGRAKAEVPILSEFNEEFAETIRINPDFLSFLILGASTEVCSMSFEQPTKPVFLKETTVNGEDDPNYVSMVVPLR